MAGYAVSHGKVRLEVARVSDHKDHEDGANAVDRSRDHNPDGSFKPGNRAAAGTGCKRAVRHLVPKRGRLIFDAICRQLGAVGGTVAYMHAADSVSHQLDAAELGELARAAGLATPEGTELHLRALRSSELAVRSATAALETARLFRPRSRRLARKGTPVGHEPNEGTS